MAKEIIQIENISVIDFKKEILLDFTGLLKNFADTLQGNSSEKLLTRQETADMLSVSLGTLWSYTRNDIIPAYKIGSKIRYKQSEILEALQKKNKFNH